MKLLPSLKQMEYLVSLAETLHFGRAAARCNITPSTLSAGIKELEKILGVSLAERTNRHVLLTAIGSEIAARARRLLGDAEQIMELAAANKAPLTGSINLGVIPTISPFLLPRVLPALNRQYPQLRLHLREEQTAPLLTRLRAGEVDAALIALPYDIEGLESRDILNDEFQFACTREHPYARKKTVPLAALDDQPLMLLEEGHCLRGHALDACRLGGLQARAQFEASSLHTLVQMVAAGIGVTLLPKLAIDAGITLGTDIQLIPLSSRQSRGIGLVWRQSSLRRQEFEILAREIREKLD